MSFISEQPDGKGLQGQTSSYRVMGCLLVPMLLWYVAMSAGFGLASAVIVSSRAFQLFYVLLSFSVGIRLLIVLKQRREGLRLPMLGIFLILISGIIWYGFGFTGTVELGMREKFTKYQTTQGRKWRFTPLLPLSLESPPAQNYGKAEVVVGKSKKELPINGRMFWKWYSIKVVGEAMAPFLIIDEQFGDIENGGFVRLPMTGEKAPYFHFGTLPHRFYLSLPENEKTVASGVTPPVLKLRIIRGKLNVLTKDVKLGELVKFEGHTVRLENGASWVRLQVKDLSALYLFLFGTALMIISGISTVYRRLKPAAVKL